MRINFERSGGFMGLQLAARFDLDDLPEDQADTLKELIDSSEFMQLPEKLTSRSPMPDQFNYVITVETEDWSHTVETGDSSAPEALKPLLERLSRLARNRAK